MIDLSDMNNCWDDYGNLKDDALQIAYQQGREDERNEWELATAELLVKYSGDIYSALPEIVSDIRKKAREDAIDELVKELHTLFTNDERDGNVVHTTAYVKQFIADVAEQIKEKKDD